MKMVKKLVFGKLFIKTINFFREPILVKLFNKIKQKHSLQITN
jgi:hypothetical protein